VKNRGDSARHERNDQKQDESADKKLNEVLDYNDKIPQKKGERERASLEDNPPVKPLGYLEP